MDKEIKRTHIEKDQSKTYFLFIKINVTWALYQSLLMLTLFSDRFLHQCWIRWETLNNEEKLHVYNNKHNQALCVG